MPSNEGKIDYLYLSPKYSGFAAKLADVDNKSNDNFEVEIPLLVPGNIETGFKFILGSLW